MMFDRLTWAGFMAAAFGWTLLLSAPQLVGLFPGLAVRWGGNLNVQIIAQCIIQTGFGLAILGALQCGFGALNKFFEAVLERSGNPRAGSTSRLPAQPKKIVERGWVKDRAYLLYMDGSVEVETMLGRRVFPSLQDAQEFIA